MDVAGTDREYSVYRPEAIAEPAPLLVLFHGFSSAHDVIAAYTGLDRLGPEAGVVVAAPQALGTPPAWNILRGIEEDRAFIDSLIGDLTGSPCVDEGNVWFAGSSAGSAFAAVYGCGRATDLAGLMLNAGLAPPICPPDATPRVLVNHGTDDPVVPFDGGEQPVGEVAVPLQSVPESVAAWAERAGCDPQAAVRTLGDDVEISTWTDCTSDTAITLHVIEGGGHTWPGAPLDAGIGATTQTFDASCVLLHVMTGSEGDPYEACPGTASNGT